MTSCMWLAERTASAPDACASDAACGPLALALAPALSGEGVESGTSGVSRPASALSAPAVPIACASAPDVLVWAAPALTLIPAGPVASATAAEAPTAPLDATAEECAESGDRW